MPDQSQDRTQLLAEINALRARVSELETAEKLRQQTEQALRQSEEKYRGLFENASIGIFHSLPEGRFLRVNPRLAEMLGYASPQELVSTITDIRTQIYIDSNKHASLLTLSRQRPGWVYAENRYRRKDGSVLIGRLAVRQVLQPDGALAYLEGFVEDISERQRLADAEHEQRTLAEALWDTAKALTSTLNLDEVFDRVLLNVGRVIPHHTAIIMLLDEERRTAAVARYFGYMPVDYEEHRYSLRLELAQTRNLRTLVETGQPLVIADVQQYEGWITFAGGEWIRSYAGVPICIQGEVIGFLNLYSATPGFYSASEAGRLQAFADQAALALQNAQLHARLQRYADELEQRVVERARELILANERLKELDRLKDEFTARLGHELLTPLANIKIYLELLETGKPEKRAVYLQTIKRETDRLLVLIEDLLRIRQLSAEGFEPEIAPGNITQLIRERLVSWVEQAALRGLEFHTQLASDLPPMLIDHDYTAQVIGHVVNNAINYTPAGSIMLSTAARSDEAGRWVTISVTDTGPGIQPDELPHIFERFFRGHAAANYKTPGIGVGLSLSREIMSRLNGRLTVETEDGVGSTFTIWLPA
jgi:PAS domain S-box-containing protein